MKHIALLVETALASGRDIVSGVADYLHERNDWSVFHRTGPLGAMQFTDLQDWEGDGIIARINSPNLLEFLRNKRIPVIDVLGNLRQTDFPLIRCDNAAISRMVGEHFTELGHRHRAFFGLKDELWSLQRREAFIERSTTATGWQAVFEITQEDRSTPYWQPYIAKLTRWIETLPKPVGIMVASDQIAPDLLEVCRRLELAIPEEVSVVGVDNDLPFCDVCQPRLSSVEPGHRQVGYEAARLLDQLIAGAPAPTETLEIPPRKLHRRTSSESTAVSDPAIIKALQVIRRKSCGGLPVDEVARYAGLSRSVLQRRFRAAVGSTVAETIFQVKLRRAQNLLIHTRLPLSEVAERAGFNHQEYLNDVFRRHLRTTPSRFRKSAGAQNPTLPSR